MAGKKENWDDGFKWMSVRTLINSSKCFNFTAGSKLHQFIGGLIRAHVKPQSCNCYFRTNFTTVGAVSYISSLSGSCNLHQLKHHIKQIGTSLITTENNWDWKHLVYCLYDMCRVTIFYLKLRIIRSRQITIISPEFLSIQTWKNYRARSLLLLLAVVEGRRGGEWGRIF